MPIKINRAGDELLGVEVFFTREEDPRGSVWIPFDEVMTLLYGKNGAGKTTLLNSLKSFLKGESEEDDGVLVYGYVRVHDEGESSRFLEKAIDDMANTGFINEWEGLETSEIQEKFRITATELGLPHQEWENSLFATIPEQWEDLDITWGKFVSHFLFLRLWENDLVHDFSSIRNFVHHLIDEKTLCLRASGTSQKPEWELTLAAHIDHGETKKAFELLLKSQNDGIDDDDTWIQTADILENSHILSARSKMIRPSSSFLPTAHLGGPTIGEIGISLIDVNEDFDLDQWTQRRATEVVYSHNVTVADRWFPRSFPTGESFPISPFFRESVQNVDEDDDEEGAAIDLSLWSASFGEIDQGSTHELHFRLTSKRLDALQLALTFIARELPEELGISDLRLTFANDLGLWILGQPAVLEGFDQRSNTWIPIRETSEATQRIVEMAIRIHSDVRSVDRVNVVIGDEIDQGLHSRAVSSLYRMLNISSTISFFTTHSIMAISSKVGRRLHIQRGIIGEVRVNPIDGYDLAITTAHQLGLQVNELIGMIDVVVAVEGIHDKLVFEHFARLHPSLSQKNLFFISISGVKQSANLLDLEFIFSFTDLQIHIIADNTSRTELLETHQSVMEKLKSGGNSTKLAKSLRARQIELKRQKWYEQACMFDVLALATERELVGRLRFGGHIYSDIVMALPSQLFGLKDDWLELEGIYRQLKTNNPDESMNFKDFIRKHYDVSIDQQRIKKALSQISIIPLGVESVLNDINNSIDRSLWV